MLPTLARPHFDIVLADLEDDTLVRLESGFGRPGLNPVS